MLRLAGVASILGVVCVVVLLWDSSAPPDPGLLASQDEARVDATTPGPELPEMPVDGSGAKPREPVAVVEAAAAESGRSGRVVDEAGRPIEGAEVSWGPLPPPHRGPPLDWKEIDLDRLRASTRWTESDASGAFSFADSPDTLDGSVLWVTHRVYRATCLVLPPGPELGDSGPIVLHEAQARTATVVADGKAREGAEVRQLADPADESDGRDDRALRAFLREGRTDSEGRVWLATLPIREGLVAAFEGLRSEPRTAPSHGDVLIELLPAFEAQGLVILEHDPVVPEGVSVAYEAHVGDDFELRGRVSVQPDGRWGPVSIPLTNIEEYRFSVEGGDVVRKTVTLRVPRSSGQVTVDFETMLGVPQWLLTVDSRTKEPLPEAKVEVHWLEEDGSRTFIDAYTREDGYVKVRGCKPGTIWYTGRHPGHAFRRGGPEVIPLDPPQTLQLSLDPAGRIEGRCVCRGEPVTDFEVMYWPGDRVNQLWNEGFVGREDGTFVLESVAAGEVSIVAHGAGYGQSEMSRVGLEPGGVTEVLLELSKGRTATGTIVDQHSGEAVVGATVQLFVTQGSRPIYKTGPAVQTDGEGHFELGGFSGVRSTFRIAAEGYAGRGIPVTATDDTTLDLGRIALPRAQTLEIRLHLAGDEDPTRYLVRTLDRGLRPTAFSAEGVVVVEDFEAELPTFEVELPGGGKVHKRVPLLPGEDWVVEIPLDGAAALALEIEPAEGEELPPDPWADVRFATASGDVLRTITVPESGRVVFEGLEPGPAYVEITDDVQTFAGQTVMLVAGQQTTARIDLDGEMYLFRVVDGAGNALPSTSVRFSLEGRPTARIGAITDSLGELRSAALSGETATVHLSHPRFGVATHIPVHLPADSSEPVILELEAEDSLSVQLRDGDEPAFGSSIELYARGTTFVLSARKTTDSEGRARWESLSTGPYDLHVHHPDYWPLRATLETGSEHTVQVRRRSELNLTVTDAEGAPYAGVAVRLRSVEFEADVRSWAEAGQVDVEPASLATDSRGRIRVQGLPHGEYDWELEAPGAAMRRGRLLVPRDRAGNVNVAIP